MLVWVSKTSGESTNLQITGVGLCLTQGDSAEDFENHDANGFAGDHVPSEKRRYHVEC